MPVFALYLALHHAGLTLETDGHKLTATPANRLNDELRAGIRQHKPALIELLQSAHHTTGRLLDWVVDLDPDTSAATALRFRSASLDLDDTARVSQASIDAGTQTPQQKAQHDPTE
ncbi:hypothetical protein CLU85_1191 [Acidovorax sp. 69]|uniref:TubC N-terminal docking domain-related protein n=1 Tax=Acidovorax sp. 69 TaxID=2035202 RepID=UPI000C2495F5|nr:hypothetical protein [Acidovorax sp. 69]PJI96445.1 hypothetical protein CLU85_1191 [Acidovorax sp. 69]